MTCSPQPRKSYPNSSVLRANSVVPVTDGSAVPNSIFAMLPPLANSVISLIALYWPSNQPVLTAEHGGLYRRTMRRLHGAIILCTYRGRADSRGAASRGL